MSGISRINSNPSRGHLRIKNVSGETIPARSIVALGAGETTAEDGARVFHVEKPSGSTVFYAITGNTDISDGEFGTAVIPWEPTWVKYDTSGTPSAGDEWGVASGSFKLDSGGKEFFVYAVDSGNELACVGLKPGGGESTCECPTVIEIELTGSPTGGTITLGWSLRPDGEPSLTADTFTLNYDDSATDVLTAIETHSEVTSGDFVVQGGPLPYAAVYIVTKSGGNFATGVIGEDIGMPVLSVNSLTGGLNPTLAVRIVTAYDWGQ